MISVILFYQNGILHLQAEGHAENGEEKNNLGSNQKGFNLACAAFTALIKTFEFSVTALCKLQQIKKIEKSGILDITWDTSWKNLKMDNNTKSSPFDGKKHNLLVLIRSLQIGMEGLKKSYPGMLEYSFELDELLKNL